MSRGQVAQRLNHPQSITSTMPEETMSRDNAFVKLSSKLDSLALKLETFVNPDHPNVQVAQMHKAVPPNPAHAPCASESPPCLESQTIGHPDARQTCNELRLPDDPFADESYPTEQIHEDNMIQDGKKGKKSKKLAKKKKNLDGVEVTDVDALPTFPNESRVQHSEFGHTTTDGSMTEPEGGRLVLPCITCHHQWVVRFKSPIIPSEVIVGEHEKAMGFTVCPTRCGAITTDAFTMEGIGPYQSTMMPTHQSTAEFVRRWLGIDEPIITRENHVLFFQQSQISDMTKLGGSVTSFRCGAEL
jgi:hypothetical protein